MKRLMQLLLNYRYLPSWLVLFCDWIIYATTFIVTYWLAISSTSKAFDIQLIIFQMLVGIPFFYFVYYFLHPHRGINHYSTTQDAIVLLFAHLAITSSLMFISLLGHIYTQKLAIPYSIIFIHYFISVLIMISTRFMIKFAFSYLSVISGDMQKVCKYNEQNQEITDLLNNLTKESDDLLVSRLKDLVPEFISSKSKFESLGRLNKIFASWKPQRKVKQPNLFVISITQYLA